MTTDRNTNRPQTTLALPVFNGENYIRRALESALAQTYSDFELIIVDNASTDATPDICQEYVARDSRIRYLQNESNIGINANFDRCVELAAGQYFCWLAHDDEMKPDYLGRCSRILDDRPDVVLVHSLVQIIDEQGAKISIYDSGLDGAEAERPSDRLRALTHVRHTCTAMFGLYRLDALRRTRILSPNHHAADRSMLAEISLIGKIVQIHEPLFHNREHSNRYVRRVKPSERAQFHQRNDSKKIEVSQLMLMQDYRLAVDKHVVDPVEKRRCKRVLRSWWFTEWNIVRLLVELSSLHAPWIYDFAKWTSDRIIKPKHPTVTQDKELRRPLK